MKTLWAVARYEVRMQRRSLAFWLTGLALLAFLQNEVVTGMQTSVAYASSPEPVIFSIMGGVDVDMAAEARQALAEANFSQHAALLLADRIGLMAALFIGVLSAFVWGRDRRYEMPDLVNARPVEAWQYVLGKYLGVVLSWALLVVPILGLGVGRAYQLAGQYGYAFALGDLALPLLGGVGVSLLYGTAFLLALSMLTRNGAATLLVYFFYWVYCVNNMAMFVTAGRLKLLSYWYFRFTGAFYPGTAAQWQQRLGDVQLNRLLYLGLTALLLAGMSVLYQRMRAGGSLLSPAEGRAGGAQPWWRRLARALRTG